MHGTAGIGDPFVNLWKKILELGPRWLEALVIVLAAWLLSKLVRRLVQRAVGRLSTEGHIDLLISKGASAAILATGVILALWALGLSLSATIAAAGLMSVGVGFALQDILSNLFAGIILLVQHPFTMGDQVSIGGKEGVVEDVRVRDTRILTYDGERVFVPNRTVFSNPIINYTSTPAQRMDVRFRIEDAADINRAGQVARRVMGQIPGVLPQPEPTVLVEAVNGSLDMVLRFWMESDRNRCFRMKSEVLASVIESLRAEGIDLPYISGEREDDIAPRPADVGNTQVIRQPPP